MKNFFNNKTRIYLYRALCFEFTCRRHGFKLSANLKLTGLWSSWEGYYIADIFHTGNIHNQSFKTDTESCVRHCSIFSCIHISSIIFRIESHSFHFLFKDIESFFSLTTSYNLSNSRY